jgi:hypothetical protein
MTYNYYRYKKKIDYIFKKNNINYIINSSQEFVFHRCPFCGTTKKDKFYFNPKTTQWICFRCSRKGNIIGLLCRLMRSDSSKVRAFLAGEHSRFGGSTINRLCCQKIFDERNSLDSRPLNVKHSLKKAYFPTHVQRFTFTTQHIRMYRRFYLYLLQRGINRQMVNYFDIRFSSFFERLVFPVYYQKKLVGWQGRAINDSIKPKALTGPKKIFQKRMYLLNYDNVVNEEYITIVEGPIDACKTIRHNPVALLGKTLSLEQLELLKQMPRLRKIIIALDPEEIEETRNIYRLISPHYNHCLVMKIELGSDCGDKTVEEIEEYFNNSSKFNYLQINCRKNNFLLD